MPSPTDVGIASLFHHVNLALGNYYIDPRGPYGAGDHLLTDDGLGTSYSNATGFVLLATGTFPPGWGRKLKFNGLWHSQDWSDDQYNPPMAYWTLFSVNLLNVPFLYDRGSMSHARELILFDNALPEAIGLHVEPGWSIDIGSIHI